MARELSRAAVLAFVTDSLGLDATNVRNFGVNVDGASVDVYVRDQTGQRIVRGKDLAIETLFYRMVD